MRSLHEITQIWLCRVLFVVAGIVPTLAVLAWAGVVQTAWHRSMYERHAAELLDADATFVAIDFPRPGGVRIRELVLRNPQTGEQIAQITSLELTQTQTGWTIHGDEIRVRNDSRGELSEWIVKLLRRNGDSVGDKIHLTLDRVQFDDASVRRASSPSNSANAQLDGLEARRTELEAHRTDTYHLVCDRIQTEHGARLNVSAAPEYDKSARVALSLLYNRQDRDGNVRLVLDSERAALHGSWIASVADHFGANCSFRGKLWARLPSNSHAWYLDGLAGEFADIELARLTAPLGDDRIDATATANIRGAIFENGRLIKIAGSIDAEGGTIGSDLVERLAKHLALKSTFDRQPATGHTDFERLAFAFALDAEGLLLEGRAGEATAVLTTAHGTLSSMPACEAVPLASVVRAVTRGDAPLVPLGSATAWLSSLLPPNATQR